MSRKCKEDIFGITALLRRRADYGYFIVIDIVMRGHRVVDYQSRGVVELLGGHYNGNALVADKAHAVRKALSLYYALDAVLHREPFQYRFVLPLHLSRHIGHPLHIYNHYV